MTPMTSIKNIARHILQHLITGWQHCHTVDIDVHDGMMLYHYTAHRPESVALPTTGRQTLTEWRYRPTATETPPRPGRPTLTEGRRAHHGERDGTDERESHAGRPAHSDDDNDVVFVV